MLAPELFSLAIAPVYQSHQKLHSTAVFYSAVMRILEMLQQEELVCDCEGSAAKMQVPPSGGISMVYNGGPMDQFVYAHATAATCLTNQA